MKRFIFYAPLVVFFALVVNWTTKYGTQWQFGPHLMPETLLAADGRHYLDGEEVDAITLSIVNSGNEGAFWLAFLGFMLLALAYAASVFWRLHRGNVRAVRFQTLMEVANKMKQAGRHEEAAKAVAWSGRLLAGESWRRSGGSGSAMDARIDRANPLRGKAADDVSRLCDVGDAHVRATGSSRVCCCE